MNEAVKEQMITDYFKMWLTQDFSKLNNIFHPDIIYQECYGPIYEGLTQVKKWYQNMLLKQKVSNWDIKRFIHSNDIVIVEWFFKATEEDTYFFDGVSIIEFTDDKINNISEFEAKTNRYYPFAE